MDPIYDIVVIGNIDYNKKFKKNNVKMLMYDSQHATIIRGINRLNEETLVPDYFDYDFISDLL